MRIVIPAYQTQTIENAPANAAPAYQQLPVTVCVCEYAHIYVMCVGVCVCRVPFAICELAVS